MYMGEVHEEAETPITIPLSLRIVIAIMVLGGGFVLIPDKKLGPAVALRRTEQEEVRDEAA